MNNSEIVKNILDQMPKEWLKLTTHRLDIYNEEQAKFEFLEKLELLVKSGEITTKTLEMLPTAFDYIRLGHPLSCVVEWVLGNINNLESEQVITFASATMPILAILRMASLSDQEVHLYHDEILPPSFDIKCFKELYKYNFSTHEIKNVDEIKEHKKGIVLLVTKSPFQKALVTNSNTDITVNAHPGFGSALFVSNRLNENERKKFIAEVQHVRRRETIALTPIHSLNLLNEMINEYDAKLESNDFVKEKDIIKKSVNDNTGSALSPILGSSGLSIQYAILMGLIDHVTSEHPDKKIKILIPTNCYGGTNDQARRVSKGFSNVDIMDLHVDGDNNMVSSLEMSLSLVSNENAVPIIITEIPTNPRVEVPNLKDLENTLNKKRKSGIAPIFVLDQTFCPNVKFLSEESMLAEVQIISYVSGSKFPSGGLCTAGYCISNNNANKFMDSIEKHLILCDNVATPHQIKTLAANMPTMPDRIQAAFLNTQEFVDGIKEVLPTAKINFVSKELTKNGFTPSVFSLDLPSVGSSQEEREKNKRSLNKKLIDHMIKDNPNDCKHCVSYGQLKSSYWTIPATSTQGTTQEGDKDYIVRIAFPPVIDIKKLLSSFRNFCEGQNLI